MSQRIKKAIIGGTGVYALEGTKRSETVHTEYGVVQVDLVETKGGAIAFLPRHGKDHSLAPHQINYRANMKALKDLGVQHIYATAAAGSLNKDMGIGDIVLLKDFLDFTQNRKSTYFQDGSRVCHVDMSQPYCPVLSHLLEEMAQTKGFPLKKEAVYACTQGPRFETAAEIRSYGRLGADLVGMTNVPEVVLAKELGMCYCAAAIVTNWCTGIGEALEGHHIQNAMRAGRDALTHAFLDIFQRDLTQDCCRCNSSLVEL